MNDIFQYFLPVIWDSFIHLVVSTTTYIHKSAEIANKIFFKNHGCIIILVMAYLVRFKNLNFFQSMDLLFEEVFKKNHFTLL